MCLHINKTKKIPNKETMCFERIFNQAINDLEIIYNLESILQCPGIFHLSYFVMAGLK